MSAPEHVSQAVDAELVSGSLFDQPLWHGSNRKLTHLRPDAQPSNGRSGEYGIFLTPSRRYARLYGPNLYAVSARVQRPMVVEGKYELSPKDLTRADIESLKKRGYDSIVVVRAGADLRDADEVVLFDASQVSIVGVY